MERYTLVIALVLVSILATATSSVLAAQTETPSPDKLPEATLTPGILEAVRVSASPAIDGQQEGLWSQAKPLRIQVSGGSNFSDGSTVIELRSVYTDDSVYFLAQWADSTQSLRREPWQKQANGSWKALTDPDCCMGDNNLNYEDKLAILWNINDSIANFNQTGCYVTCHAGEAPKPYGNKYTSSPGEVGDIWEWGSVCTEPTGQLDDQFLDNTRHYVDAVPDAGRKKDPWSDGGYFENITRDGGLPRWALPGNQPAPPYWITDAAKVALDDTKYSVNDEVPGIVTAPFRGDRGDITGKAVWGDNRWTLEWGRNLITKSQYDIRFVDLTRTYYFGIAVFDNSQVRHAFHRGVNRLEFLPAGTAEK